MKFQENTQGEKTMNRRKKSILAFWLCMVIFFQTGFGIWAAEPKDTASFEETQDEENGQEDDQISQDDLETENEEEAEESDDSEDEGESEDERESEDEKDPEDGTTPEEDEEIWEYIKKAQKELKSLAGEETLMALVYLCDNYAVKATADPAGETVTGLPSGSMTFIKGMEVDDDFNLWFQVSFEKNGASYKGYILREYLAYSNERLLEWEDACFPRTMYTAADGYPDIEQFPASYQDKLIQLKQAHPDWTFVRQNTYLDWSNVVSG